MTVEQKQFFQNAAPGFELDSFLHSMNKEDVIEGIYRFLKNIRNEIRKQSYSICYSESAVNEALWIKYADQHRGFAIEYDTAIPLQTTSTSAADKQYTIPHCYVALYPMYYSNKQYDATEYARDFSLFALLRNLVPPEKQYMIAQMMPKHEWESERISLIKKKCHEPDQEWRMLLGTPFFFQGTPYLYWVPSRVILGLNAEASTKTLVIQAAERAGIHEIAEAYINDKDKLVIRKIK